MLLSPISEPISWNFHKISNPWLGLTRVSIFEEVAQVVTKYEYFIEKFVGDAILAIT